MKKATKALIVAGAVALLMAVGLLWGAGSAIEEAGAANVAIIRFDTSTLTVTLPTSGPDYCPLSQDGCDWTLYVNEPATGVVVFSGILGDNPTTIRLPEYCGNVQADLSLNGEQVKYSTKQVELCTPPTTTTTTTVAPTTTTTTTSPPPVATQPPASQPPAAPQIAPQGSVPPTPSTPTPVAAPSSQPAAAQLPFTGLDWQPLAGIGSALVTLGLLLMRRRRFATK